MTIDEAISHALKVAERYERMEDSHDDKLKEECLQCAADHRQLAEWLTELKELSLQIAAPRLDSIEEYHYELAKCKTAFWSCNKRCMDAQEQYRRKADELRKAQEQIAEYKRLLKAAVEDMYNSVNDVHCKYCSKWHTDQCQGTSHLDCYIENKFKWRYADEALKLIGEDGGNDDTITGS